MSIYSELAAMNYIERNNCRNKKNAIFFLLGLYLISTRLSPKTILGEVLSHASAGLFF